jgi:hypothetical protein
MNCENARQDLVLFIYGELSFEEEERLERHLAECSECALERKRLERLDTVVAQARVATPAGLLGKCRRDLSTRLHDERSPSRRFSLGALWRAWVLHPPMWLRPVGALAMVAVGFFGARMVPMAGTAGLPQLAQREQAASAVARVRLVNTEPTGLVRVQYDEVRPREIAGDPNDERIRRLLLTAAADPADPGVRVDSLELLKDHAADDQVRQALLNALRSDPNSGVRLKALEGLKSFARDAETRKVLAHVLLSDDNPSVRTQAIDLLVQSKAPDVAGVLQELMRREDNGYLRSRCQKALNEMKASVGTF